MLSPDQITAIAPDAASLKAGRDLGTPRKWVTTGGDEEALWGLAMGSGKEPYQTRVCISDLATKCSCPSRKFPCKHALGLMFLAANSPATLSRTERPDWVREWFDARSARLEKAAARDEEKPSKPPDEKAAAKRQAQREGRMAEGILLLRQTLLDLIREGLGSPDARSPDKWAEISRRMVDCQLPGLASALRNIGEIALSDPDVDQELAHEIGRVFLILHGIENIASQAPAMQAELRELIGGRIDANDPHHERVKDQWFVASRTVSERDHLITSSTWLRGIASGRWARILRFTPLSQPLSEIWPLGTQIETSLAFPQGLLALRAFTDEDGIVATTPVIPDDAPGLESLLDRFSQALALHPFLRSIPFLTSLRPSEDLHSLIDPDGRSLPWKSTAATQLAVEAICGGHPTTVCGEWNGRHLTLLAIDDNSHWTPLTPQSP